MLFSHVIPPSPSPTESNRLFVLYICVSFAVLHIIRDIKGTFHAKTGTIKDRNGMDLTEAEDTKKRWQAQK